MNVVPLTDALATELYARSGAEGFGVPAETFAEALRHSAARALASAPAGPRDVERYLRALHVEDLGLALACAAGAEAAWDHFMREYRPALYRAADALDATGRAREIADSLYADLYGVQERGAVRQSLFRYYHGRSSLATWLRAVLAQRHVDAIRSGRRTEPLPDDDAGAAPSTWSAPQPDRQQHVALVIAALHAAIAALAPRDRLRFACYYADGLTLAATGRILGEHEASASRNLARTRRALREAVERRLREGERLSEESIRDAFASAAEDPGDFDVTGGVGGGLGVRSRFFDKKSRSDPKG